MNNLDEIWEDGDEKLPDKKILAYLEGRLTASEKWEVEKFLSERNMEHDALEGLKLLDGHAIHQTTARLRAQLSKQVGQKARQPKPYRDPHGIWIAVFLVLLLVILAFIVVWIAL